jgi:hypothetical protein
MKSQQKSVLAWFLLEDLTLGEFEKLVTGAGAIYEGGGTDKRTGDVEGYAIFANKAKCHAFAKAVARHGVTLIDLVH